MELDGGLVFSENSILPSFSKDLIEALEQYDWREFTYLHLKKCVYIKAIFHKNEILSLFLATLLLIDIWNEALRDGIKRESCA